MDILPVGLRSIDANEQLQNDYTFDPSAATALPSSSMWNRRFSSSMTDPGAGLAQAASTSGPTQSLRKRTSLTATTSSTGCDMSTED